MEWVREYIDYMLKGEPYDEKAMDLKLNHFPKSLYKYRELNDYTIESLEHNLLWVAGIDSLNDPFECSLLLDIHESWRNFFRREDFPEIFKTGYEIELTKEEIQQIINSPDPYLMYSKVCSSKGIILKISSEQHSDKTKPIFNVLKDEWKTTISICSFSECYDSLLMWSHYANQHKGVCVEYDFTDCDEFRCFIQPVLYSNEVFKIKSVDEMNIINYVIASICKAKEWEYEKEWRLTPFSKRILEENKNLVSAPTPKAIYLGTRFDLNDDNKKLQLERIIKNKNIPIYQMENHKSEYKLVKA